MSNRRLALIAACSFAFRVAANGQAVADSAVKLWRYPTTARAPVVWTLDPRPVLEIGKDSADGPYVFANIAGVAVLGDGRLAIADSRANQVRIFSHDGHFQRALGRHGQGPGEFDLVIWSVFALGDTIFATDNSERAQMFSASGEILRSVSRPAVPHAIRPERIGLLSGGSVAVAAYEYPRDTSGAEYVMTRVVFRESANASGAQYDRIIVTPGYTRQHPSTPPLGPLYYGATSAVSAHGDRICSGNSDAYDITCFDSRGRAVFRVQRSIQPRPITAEVRDLARRAYLAGNRRAGQPAEMVQRTQMEAQRFRFAEHAPAFGRMLLAENGELWIGEFDPTDRLIGSPPYRTPREPLRWSVYSPSGNWIADLQLPARFVPYAISGNEIAGVSQGADDVQSVTVWRVRR